MAATAEALEHDSEDATAPTWSVDRWPSPSRSARSGVSLAPQAEAGSYIVRECSLGRLTAAPDAVYTTNGALAFTPANNCNNRTSASAIGTQGNGFADPCTPLDVLAPRGRVHRLASTSSGARSRAVHTPRSCPCASAGGTATGTRTTRRSRFRADAVRAGRLELPQRLHRLRRRPCNAGGHIAVRDLEFTIDDVDRAGGGVARRFAAQQRQRSAASRA